MNPIQYIFCCAYRTNVFCGSQIYFIEMMKIFQSTKQFLANVGIAPDSRPFNLRNSLTLLVFGITVILVSSFLFCEANTFKEYTESIYMTSVSWAIFITFLSVIWKKEYIFLFTDQWEKIAETSKLSRAVTCAINIYSMIGEKVDYYS